MKKIILILIAFLSTITLTAGRYAGDFMAIGAGVRALGMGGAFAALADDGAAIYWNASGIAQIRDTEIAIMRAFLYEGLAYYDNFSLCQPLPNDVTLGVNWTRLTIDDIPIFKESHIVGTNVDQRSSDLNWILNEAGIPDGKFTSTDDLYQFAFAKHLRYNLNLGWLFYDLPLDFHFGGNIKYIKRNISDEEGEEHLGIGNGFDLSFLVKTDMAILFDFDWLGNIALGMNFQDVGGTIVSWRDLESKHEDEILFNTKLGIALEQPLYFIRSRIIMTMDVDYVYETQYHYGLEYFYKELVSLRAGYCSENYSAGASLKLYDVSVDYAFLTNVLGNTNRIGLRISF
ncbi:MAG: hypothetical protein JXB60_05295 [Candidatus Cloacimonetes bacterium]|nr:hypothetical protein [Candidatus Cloacimonadota bacterium]